MATIKDVARMAGVSMSTVSKYINGKNVRPECADAIRSAIESLDYRVNPFARSLKTQRSNSIGILLPDISAPFFGSVVTALDRTLREHGYHTLICCYSANHSLERDKLQYLISTGIAGLLYIPEDLSSEEYYELTANCNIPLVQMDRLIQGVTSDAVLVNNADAVYAATCELIRRGHRRIGLISGPKFVFSAKERQVGFLRAPGSFLTRSSSTARSISSPPATRAVRTFCPCPSRPQPSSPPTTTLPLVSSPPSMTGASGSRRTSMYSASTV